MKHVYQNRFRKNNGNCSQAAIASLLEIPLEKAFDIWDCSDDDWWDSMLAWFEAEGYSVDPNMPFGERKGVKGFFIAIVPSMFFDSSLHAVVINIKGMVAHDPNPNGKWLGRNVFHEDVVESYYPVEE